MKNKYESFGWELLFPETRLILLKMKLIGLLIIGTVLMVHAENGYAQQTKLSLDHRNSSIKEVLQNIEEITEFSFMFDNSKVNVSEKVSLKADNLAIDQILNLLFTGTDIVFEVIDRQIILFPSNSALVGQARSSQPQFSVGGKVTDRTGGPLPGVTVVVKGTTIGTITNPNGTYSLVNLPQNAVLIFSFVGMRTQEVPVDGKSLIDITLADETFGIEEVVAIGYGTMRRSDLTGSVVRADLESFSQSPNLSIVQSLHGSIPGLSVGQVNQAGQDPDMLIRGQSTLSGELAPLVVVDGVIYRGNLIDLNPKDIESVDILKDASSAAIYGSQAANGVILITTTKSGGINGKPSFTYSGSYAFQSPVKELRPGSPADFNKKSEESDIRNSRTVASSYREINPLWDITSNMKSSEEIAAYEQGRYADWFSLLTNNDMYLQNHNLSMANSSNMNNYLVSIGFTDQKGYMLNEGFERINARINMDNMIKDWFKVGIQSFVTSSKYPGQAVDPAYRFFSPYMTPEDQNGERVQIVGGLSVNPFTQAEADYINKRMSFFGNVYANIDFPFIKGLTYNVNFSNTYRNNSEYYFRSYASNFQGQGSKEEGQGYDWSFDNILSFKRNFGEIHNIDITLVYGMENRSYNTTRAISSVFISDILGYNRLQAGSSELQQALSSAWEEASLYNMGRLFYSLKNRYLLTGTIRRDGFSGFSSQNKFGWFPSLSLAWVTSEEEFLKNVSWINLLKWRISYGSVGNRTIGRYQTLAKVEGGFSYVSAANAPVYGQSIVGLASPNLKWETTTGVNLGVDFGVFNMLNGSIDFYDNNTTNLLYEVDLPGISRFTKFPDNLGRLHNKGLEISLTSTNLKRNQLLWTSTFNFYRNRNSLKELLGFDLDGDGKEDDLISEGLFIGQSIDAIYDYSVDGKWQLGETILAGYDLGAHKVVDLNGDGIITAGDKSILGYRSPSYAFGINNSIRYKSLALKFFINSVQGGKNYYLAPDNMYNFNILNGPGHFNNNFPSSVEYWTPENPNAKYQRPGIQVSSGLAGTLYSQRNFVRLQDISLSYDMESALINSLGFNNLRFYISGKNILTLSKWDGWDPETGEGITRNGRPVVKSYTLGVNIEF